MIGIIKGRRIGKNRDGDKNVLLLQVEIIENEDARTIEIFSSGDFNPANGTRVYICDVTDSYQIAVATSDGLTPEVQDRLQRRRCRGQSVGFRYLVTC